MSIKNLEIKPSEAKAVEIASLPTRPTSSATYGGRGLTAQEMKKAYDAYPALIKERFNALIADLLSGIAISDIPFSIPSHEPFGENIEKTVKGFLDAVGAILDFGTDDARTIYGFVKQFVSDVAMATSLEYDKSTQLLTLTIDGEEKSVTIDFLDKFDQFETAIAELRSTIQTLDETKFDKSGGGITGDVNIGGSAYIGKDLTVAGNSIIQEAEHLQVKDAVIVMNKDGEILTVPAGSVIRKGVNADGVDETYAIMYDPVSDSVKLGLVYQDENGNYQFLAGEGYPVATRADSSVMQDGMFAVWDATNRRFVTSDVNLSVVNGLTERVENAEGDIESLQETVLMLGDTKLDAIKFVDIIYATDGDGNQTTITYTKGEPAAENVPVMDDQARLYAVTTGEEPMGTPLSDFVLANRYYVDSADNKIKDTVSKQAADIDLLYTLIENTIITLTTVEDAYEVRVTAGGLPVVSNTPTTVHKIAGDTKASENLFDLSNIGSGVKNGITFSFVNNNIMLSGTLENSAFNLFSFELPAHLYGKTVTFSQSKYFSSYNDAGSVSWIITKIKSDGSLVELGRTIIRSYTMTFDEANVTYRIYLGTSSWIGSTCDEETISFMANLGSEALPYSDYYAGMKNAAFLGITSTGTNGEIDASFMLSYAQGLRKWDYIDVDKQELVIGTEEEWKGDGEAAFTEEELAAYPEGFILSVDRRIIAYPLETPMTEPLGCPKTYKVWRNGMETLDTGDTEAVLPTVTQTYYEEVTA